MVTFIYVEGYVRNGVGLGELVNRCVVGEKAELGRTGRCAPEVPGGGFVSAGRGFFPDRLTDRSPLPLPQALSPRPRRPRARPRDGRHRQLRPLPLPPPLPFPLPAAEREPADGGRGARLLPEAPPALLRAPRPTCVHGPPRYVTTYVTVCPPGRLPFQIAGSAICDRVLVSEIVPTTRARTRGVERAQSPREPASRLRPPYVFILSPCQEVDASGSVTLEYIGSSLTSLPDRNSRPLISPPVRLPLPPSSHAQSARPRHLGLFSPYLPPPPPPRTPALLASPSPPRHPPLRPPCSPLPARDARRPPSLASPYATRRARASRSTPRTRAARPRKTRARPVYRRRSLRGRTRTLRARPRDPVPPGTGTGTRPPRPALQAPESRQEPPLRPPHNVPSCTSLPSASS